jgi:TRAP-type C4-dicarboxylate transport system substrate-binding protein
LAAAVLVLTCGVAPGRAGEPEFLLRLAALMPDGTPMARELRAFGRNVEAGTNGHVRIKWYLNAMAGDEMEMEERIRRGQLDGAASGQALCDKIAPSMRVTMLPGLFQSREEVDAIMNGLSAVLDEEAHRAGFVLLGTVPLGSELLFSRAPVRSMEELRGIKLWRWDVLDYAVQSARAMGLQVVPLPLSEAARAYDEHRVDAFFVVPTVALAYQWTVRAHYVTEVRSGAVVGGLIIAERAFTPLPIQYQQIIRTATASLRERLDEQGRQIDAQLLGGLLQKQGMRVVPVSESFRAGYFAATRAARDGMGDRAIPKALLDRVLRMLADYRAEQP